MKKRLLLTIITLFVLSPKGFCQSNGNLEQDYYLGINRSFCWEPIVGFCTTGNWYYEARINYEATHAVALYLGKTFKKKALISYSITPLAGLVMDGFKGGSVGANVTVDYKKISFSSQSQYTFSVENQATNFTYSWSDLTYQLKRWTAAGVSLQQTRGQLEKGILIKGVYKNLSMPLYVFNPASSERYFIVGLDLEWDN